jgi:choice-of-anchor B domain-containing protein
MSFHAFLRLAAFCGLVASLPASSLAADMSVDPEGLTEPMRMLLADRPAPGSRAPLEPMHETQCIDGMADGYPCENIDLLAFVPVSAFSASSTNSLWGWTDPDNGDEYALIGANNGIAFYRLTPDPTHPVYLGKLPTHTGNSMWRDVRVYQHYAYVGSDVNSGTHGIQVFDLHRLRGQTQPQTFTEDGHYGGFGNSHTLSVNEDTGYLAVAGARQVCGGGLHLLDIHTNPLVPTYAGCVNQGYTHESQCFTYHGPDTAHAGKDICINANGESERIAIIDATNATTPISLSSITYQGSSYPHQAWFSEDHRYILMDDELDEGDFGHPARTYVFDAFDLEAPVLVGYHDSPLNVIDHNLYVHGQYVYQSNYEAGLRILKIDNLSAAAFTEVAYFDVYPGSNARNFNGTWNNFLFPSGVVVVTGIDEGFFVLRPNLCDAPDVPLGLSATATGNNLIDLAWNAGDAGTTFRVERAQGGCNGTFATIAEELTQSAYSDAGVSGQVPFGYRVSAVDTTGRCASPASQCVEATAPGQCTAPPLFSGVGSVVNAGTPDCRVYLAWPPANAACGGTPSYSIYRSSEAGFTPGPGNRIQTNWSNTAFADLTPHNQTREHYIVRAVDAVSGAEDDNLKQLSVVPSGPLADGSFTTGAEPFDPPLDTAGSENLVPQQPNHAGWHIIDSDHHSGSQSFWSIDADNVCITLEMPPMQLTAGQSPALSFWTKWDIEPDYDGGVIQISTNGGNTWSILTPNGGYPDTFNNGPRCNNGGNGIPDNSRAFSSYNHTEWTQYSVDLSAWAGQTVQLRWLFGTDVGVTGEGWYIDDIELTHAQVPGACVSIQDSAVFANGFEGSP